MTVDEKIEQSIRKKQMALDLIKGQNFRKALKIFKTINAYFDYGTFTQEEKEKMKPYQISALLNTTLCQLKQKEWKDLCGAAEKILILEKNAKAIYRKA